MNPKLLTTVTFLFLLLGINSYSQHHHEKLKSLKIGYLTETLELTSKEAEGFWPIYNLHQENIHQIRYIDIRELRRKINTEKDLKDKDAEIILDNLLKKEEAILAERSKMFKKLKTVLPPKKLLKLFKSEIDFNQKILKEYRTRSKNGYSKRSNK